VGEVPGPVALHQYVEYFEDVTGSASVQQVLTLPLSDWSQGNADTPSFGYSDSAFWFRFRLNNTERFATERVLDISYPLLDDLTLYQVLKGDALELATMGDIYPYEKRIVDHRNFIFPLSLDAQKTTTFYLKVKTTSSFQVPMAVWKERAFFEDATLQAVVHGVFFGIMLVMVLYNGFVFLVVRDVSYLFYVFYVTSFALLQSTLYGFSYEYLWPDSMWWNDKAVAVFIPLTLFFVVLFTRVFLEVPDHESKGWVGRRFSAITAGLIGLDFVVVVGAFFFPYVVMIKLSILATILNALAILILGFSSLLSGNRAAKYFCLAWVMLLVSVIVYSLNKFGWVPRSFFTENFMQLGSAAEVILLSFALADRFNKERQEKYEAQQLALSHALKAQEVQKQAVAIQKESHEKELEAFHKVVEAEAESKAKTQFLATMSHEIRTPMNGVIGMAELMSDTPLNEQQYSYLDVIRNSGQSLLTIINDILDYAKISAGEMELEQVDVDLQTFIQESIAMFRPQAEKNKVEIGAIIHKDCDGIVIVDPTRLRQIITNLLSHPLQFTEHGSVSLTVSDKQSEGGESYLRFEIQDTGIGISLENQQKLFTAFKQADASTTRRFGGTGLGLSICKQLVEVMGGNIGVSSEPDQGSNFWFEIVKNQPHSQSKPMMEVGNAPPPSFSCTLLSMKPLIKRLVDNACRRWAFLDVNVIGDVETAEDWEGRPDKPQGLIIIDQEWPEEPYQLVKRLQETNQFSLNIGLMVRMGFDLSAKRREELGVRFLMQKPISDHEVLEKLQQFAESSAHEEKVVTKSSKYPDLSHLRVLIAEDNPVNQMVIVGMLSKFKIKTEVAENGKLALEKFQAANDPASWGAGSESTPEASSGLVGAFYDFVLMDCEMPEMDGFETTRRMREFEKKHSYGATPIIALTAHAMKEYKDHFLNAGMDAYLVKPITLERLNTVLQGLPKESR